MAGRPRYLKEQNGHFYTRIAVPKELQPFIGKTQFQASLGSERKAAERLHHGSGAKFQADTRTALLDDTLTLVISHPLDRMSRDLIRGMVKATTNRHGGNWSSVTPFDMHNREYI